MTDPAAMSADLPMVVRDRRWCGTISHMEEPEPEFVGIRLWDRSVLVLLDWLLETDESSLPYTHPAQKQALRDLQTAIEWARGLGYTDAELAVAQEQVSSNMSDEDRRI